jgi:hypothetical protein
MPTGYTAELIDKGQDFRTFTLTCARAFGACIMQRDDPMNEPPKKQEPTDWHVKRLAEAKDKIARLKAMSAEESRAHGEHLRQESVQSAEGHLAKNQAQNERLDDMAVQVRAWLPPSEDHEPLKAFMLQQIDVSRNSDYARKALEDAKAKTPEAYFVEAVSEAVRSVSYHTEENQKEIERADSRNRWIEQLYESLPS